MRKDVSNVSVCMATFNGELYIIPQIKSILVQLSINDELIISDDNSTDSTIEKILSLKDERIKLFTNAHASGVIGNFYNALGKAKNEYVFLADQDDLWREDKVEVLMRSLQTFDLVVSDCYFIDSNGDLLGSSFFESYNSGKGVLKNLLKNSYLGNCMAFNKSILGVLLPFPAQLFKASKYKLYHDVWIGILCNILFKVAFVPDKLSFYRRHENNASNTNSDAISTNSLLDKLIARYLLILGLTKRIIKVLIIGDRII